MPHMSISPPILPPHAQQPHHHVRETAAHLHCRAFSPGGATEKMRHQRADQHQWSHARGHAAAGLVNLVDEQVVPFVGALAQIMIQQTHKHPAKRQKPKQLRMGPLKLCHLIKCPQEKRRRRASQQRHGHRESGAAQKMAYVGEKSGASREHERRAA
jgi:hypothetical protein